MFFSGTSRFKVIRHLGTGGMGSVYLVDDEQLKTKVALKILNFSDGRDLYQFKREFRSMLDLQHVNLVKLHELISEGPLWFFTMEYVEGVPFDRYLRPHLTPANVSVSLPAPKSADPSSASNRERTLRAIRQLCDGVHAIHEAGSIHRDLKPSNVLVTEKGRVVILDFGLTKKTGSTSMSTDGMSGTPAYMAPEQALERPCLPAADWYAVGTMIYEVLTGRCPFDGALFEVLLKKQSEDPPPPERINPEADDLLGELCMRLLHRDPTQRPSGPEILARLGVVAGKRTTAISGRHTPIGVPVLGVFGREQEMQTLYRAYASMRKGGPAVVMVKGTSGIGKTSLVETFLKDLTHESSTSLQPLVLRGRCHERETLPFKAFDSVVDSLSHRLASLSAEQLSYVLPDGILYLAEIFPVLRRLKLAEEQRYFLPPLRDAKELRNQAFDAFCELLVHLARIQPVVIFIDDMQWADRDSCALLRTLLQAPNKPSLLWLVNSRPISDHSPGTVGALLLDLEDLPGVESCTLGPLSTEATHALVEFLLDAEEVDPETSERIAQSVMGEAEGNPFFAVELVQHFRGVMASDGGLLTASDERAFSLDGMILKRVGNLPSESQRMLEVIAVAGDPLPQRSLASAAGIPLGSEEWERGISALIEGRLVTRRGRQGTDVVDVYHDRIGEAVTANLDQEALRQVHLQLAQAVEQSDRERTDMLARYWLSAHDLERAKRYACDAAGEALAKLAFDRAAELYETAIDLEHDDQAKAQLLQALGNCRASNGHPSLAASAYQQAASLGDTVHSLRMHHLAAEQLLRGGQIAQGLDVMRGVLKQAGLRLSAGPRRAIFSIVWRLLWLRVRGLRFVERPASSISARDKRLLDVLWSANIGLSVVDTLRADDCLLRFLKLALKVGDMRRVAQGFAILSGQLAALGTSHFAWALRLVTEAEVLARRSADPAIIGIAGMAKGIIRYLMGEWDEAANHLSTVEQYFLSHCHGVSWELSTTRSFACFALRLAGRLRDLCERFDRYTTDADRTGDRYLAANLRTYQSMVWLIRDDCARASKEIEGILAAWPRDMYQVQHFFHLYARCEQALYAEHPDVALAAIATDTPKMNSSALLKIKGIHVEFSWICGRAAVAMAEGKPKSERLPYLRQARESVKFLRHGEHQTGVAMGAFVEAAALWLSPKADQRAGTLALERAVAIAESAGSLLLAEAGRRWLGEIVGGSRGKELRARSNGWMAEQGVQNPARLAHLVVPGFRGPAA
jgi:serine/threonine protein kinase